MLGNLKKNFFFFFFLAVANAEAQSNSEFRKPPERESNHSPACLTSGDEYRYKCVIPDSLLSSEQITLTWEGEAFRNQCPHLNTAENDKIQFGVPQPNQTLDPQTCGNFTAGLSRNQSGVESFLSFRAIESFHNQTINCTGPQRDSDNSGLIGFDRLQIGSEFLFLRGS